MSKERRTVSIPEEVDDHLSREGVNASELVAKLVKQHMNGGATQDQILEFRIEQVQSKVEDIRGRLERKERELEELKARRREHREQQHQEYQSKLEKARKKLEDVPHHPENAAVQHWAEKLDLTPEDLIDKLE